MSKIFCSHVPRKHTQLGCWEMHACSRTDKLYHANINNNKLFYSERMTRAYLRLVPLCTINQPLPFFINRSRVL